MCKVVAVSPIAADGWVRVESSSSSVDSWEVVEKSKPSADGWVRISQRNITPSVRFKLAHRCARANKWRLGSEQAKKLGMLTYSDLFKDALRYTENQVDALASDLCYLNREMLRVEHHLGNAVNSLFEPVIRRSVRTASKLCSVEYHQDRLVTLRTAFEELLSLYTEVFGTPSAGEDAAIAAAHQGKVGSWATSHLLGLGFNMLTILKAQRKNYHYECFCEECEWCADNQYTLPH